ncbi:MAG: hypothetical protein Q8R92_10410 [Deltaproteobacteria bacterium]|nr:hypothetical protein [Deltaproteobacteria bacterium]
MQGLMAPLLKTAIKAYLKGRFGDRFGSEEYDRLAEEFKVETTNEEFSALRKLDGDERRDLVRAIGERIQARVKKTGTKEDKALVKRFMTARAKTSTSAKPAKARKRNA